MKFFCWAICLTSMLFFECSREGKSQSAQNDNASASQADKASFNRNTAKSNSSESNLTNQAQRNSPMTDRKKEGDLEYEITVKKDAERVLINYRVKNTGKKSYLLFNRGISPNCETGKAFVEPSEDGTIEIAQKLYRPPQAIECPALESPIEQGVSILKPGQTASEGIWVSLSLKYDTPYNYCYRGASLLAMPESAKKVRFCLGYVEADSGKMKFEGCVIKEWQGRGDQKLLCSDLIELK